jgi:hypothetical protein
MQRGEGARWGGGSAGESAEQALSAALLGSTSAARQRLPSQHFCLLPRSGTSPLCSSACSSRSRSTSSSSRGRPLPPPPSPAPTWRSASWAAPRTAPPSPPRASLQPWSPPAWAGGAPPAPCAAPCPAASCCPPAGLRTPASPPEWSLPAAAAAMRQQQKLPVSSRAAATQSSRPPAEAPLGQHQERAMHVVGRRQAQRLVGVHKTLEAAGCQPCWSPCSSWPAPPAAPAPAAAAAACAACPWGRASACK